MSYTILRWNMDPIIWYILLLIFNIQFGIGSGQSGTDHDDESEMDSKGVGYVTYNLFSTFYNFLLEFFIMYGSLTKCTKLQIKIITQA